MVKEICFKYLTRLKSRKYKFLSEGSQRAKKVSKISLKRTTFLKFLVSSSSALNNQTNEWESFLSDNAFLISKTANGEKCILSYFSACTNCIEQSMISFVLNLSKH